MDHEKLRKLTEEADRQHTAAMATVHQDFEAAHFGGDDPEAVASRRAFLRRAGTAAVVVGAVSVPLSGIAAAAIGQGGMGGGGGATSTTLALPASDAQIVTFAETVERAAAAAYGLALDRRLLTSSAENSARVFQGHHTAHADALMGVLGGTEAAPNAALVAQLSPQIDGARDERSLITLLESLEAAAAATYYSALGQIQTATVAGAASTILPVEAQHQLVWAQALGQPLSQAVPTFQSATGAIAP